MRAALSLVLMVWAFGLCAADDGVWTALREGRAVLLLRHANAPGLGDPPGFVLDDCATQRNLDSAGRAQAQRWGALLREKGISKPRVISSRWCRALETANEMELGLVEPFAALDSFFAQPEGNVPKTETLHEFLAGLSAAAPPIVLITHQVNITALTGVFPRSGEGLILALPFKDRPQVLARISPP